MPAPPASGRVPWLPPALVAPWKEIFCVVVIIIGVSAWMSALQAWSGSSGHYVSDLLTDRRMVHTLVMESAILGLLFMHLSRLGWRAADFRIKFNWSGSGEGLLLVPGMLVANSVAVAVGFIVLFFFQTDTDHFATFVAANGPHLQPHSIHVSWFAVIPALVFNGFFEEITCMGYAFNQFAAKRGPFFALVLTVMLRMLCHTYQGPVHMLGIGAAFFVSGLVYWWTRNLWPLILAHIIVDLLSFVVVKSMYG